MLKDAERNIHLETKSALPESAEDTSPHGYGRYNDAGPAYFPYVPQQHEGPFSLDDPSDDRHAYMDVQDEQPQPDNSHDFRDQRECAQAWTGTNTYFLATCQLGQPSCFRLHSPFNNTDVTAGNTQRRSALLVASGATADTPTCGR